MATPYLIILVIAIVLIILVQLSKVVEMVNSMKNARDVEYRDNRSQGVWLIVFMVAFLVFCVWSAWHYKDQMLGYGPWPASSEHGDALDSLFDVTLFFTGIVFFITQFLLFYFSYKYRGRHGQKALFISHNDKLEIWWSIIPAVVMAFLVIKGLLTWNKVMDDVKPGDDYIEIEATGMQFNWLLRYPGPDGALGNRDYKLITGNNSLGQDWNDVKNLDDILPDKIVLPVNKKVRVRITSRDVLHNFYLPHFRVKMDAIPGIPTYFVFTPKETTKDFRERLRASGKYDFPYDKTDTESKPYWEEVNFELACAELCGNGHFSMRKIVEIVSEEEYNKWLGEQKSKYLSSVRFTDEDPFRNQLLDFEVKERAAQFMRDFEKARAMENTAERIVRLRYVEFESGSSRLTPLSKYELDNVVDVLRSNGSMTLELAGHTDNTGNAADNLTLSGDRANAVHRYLTGKGIDASRLTAVGYGQDRPIDTNDTAEGRQNNRRTEIKIINQ